MVCIGHVMCTEQKSEVLYTSGESLARSIYRYVYKLASHDKCQYAILNKEQKGITDSRRVSSLPLTCTDAPPYTHTHTLTCTASVFLSSFIIISPSSAPCRFLLPVCLYHAVLRGEAADWSFGHPPLGVSQPCNPALQPLVHRAQGEGVAAAERKRPKGGTESPVQSADSRCVIFLIWQGG